MTTTRPATTLLATILLCGILGLTLTACNGRTDPAPIAATGGPAPTLPPEVCAGIGDRVKEHLNSPEVRSVAVQGQCTSVVITTTLGDNDDAAAVRLCETAAEVAYSGDVNSVSVLAGSGGELAIGIPGAKCLT